MLLQPQFTFILFSLLRIAFAHQAIIQCCIARVLLLNCRLMVPCFLCSTEQFKLCTALSLPLSVSVSVSFCLPLSPVVYHSSGRFCIPIELSLLLTINCCLRVHTVLPVFKSLNFFLQNIPLHCIDGRSQSAN